MGEAVCPFPCVVRRSGEGKWNGKDEDDGARATKMDDERGDLGGEGEGRPLAAGLIYMPFLFFSPYLFL